MKRISFMKLPSICIIFFVCYFTTKCMHSKAGEISIPNTSAFNMFLTNINIFTT